MWRWTGSVFGSANGLSPVRRQAIPWTNAALLSIGHLRTNFGEIWIQIKKLFIHENAFKTVACEMATNLFRGRGVNFLILFSRPLLTENTKQQKQKNGIVSKWRTWQNRNKTFETQIRALFQCKDHLSKYGYFHHKDKTETVLLLQWESLYW